MLFIYLKVTSKKSVPEVSIIHFWYEPFLGANGAIANFPADNNNIASFKFKLKIAGRTGNDGTKNVKITLPLKYFSHFWINLEMSLINCEINLILTLPNRCFIIDNPIVGQNQHLQ